MGKSVQAVCVAILLWYAFFLCLSPANAGQGCPHVHIVEPGDSVIRLAELYQVTDEQIILANRIENPDLIRVGQELCIPTVPASDHAVTSPPPLYPHFDLIAEYRPDIIKNDEQTKWSVGRNGRIGKRVEYPLVLASSVTASLAYSTPTELAQASKMGAPLLWLMRNGITDVTTYTLMVIGDPTPLLALQLATTPTKDITDILPSLKDPAILEMLQEEECVNSTRIPPVLLAGEMGGEVQLRAEMITADGIFVPIDISHIDYRATPNQAVACGDEIGFALHPSTNSQLYQLLLVLSRDGVVGPPGGFWVQRCASWRGGGWWYRWMSRWYGC